MQSSAGVLDLSTAYPDILLISSAEIGVSEVLVEQVSSLLASCGFQVSKKLISEVAARDLLDTHQAILCLSMSAFSRQTENVLPLLEAGEEEGDLAHLAFGMIKIGDCTDKSTRHLIEKKLIAAGAVEVAAPLHLPGDLLDEYIDKAEFWSLDCVAAFAEAFADVAEGVY